MPLQPPFRDKPWYLAIFTAGRWVTTYPHINLPNNTDPAKFPWIVAHESVHLRQQKATGLWKWLWKYYTSRTFRLDQEAEGAAAEYLEQVRENRNATQVLQNYAEFYTSIAYLWAAKSQTEALEVLNAKVKSLQS